MNWKARAAEVLREAIESYSVGFLRSALHGARDALCIVCDQGLNKGSILSDHWWGDDLNREFDFKLASALREMESEDLITAAHREVLSRLNIARDAMAHDRYETPARDELHGYLTATLALMDCVGVELAGHLTALLQMSSSWRETNGLLYANLPITGEELALGEYRNQDLGIATVVPQPWRITEEDESVTFSDGDVFCVVEARPKDSDDPFDMEREVVTLAAQGVEGFTKSDLNPRRISNVVCASVRYSGTVGERLVTGWSACTPLLQDRDGQRYYYFLDCYGSPLGVRITSELFAGILGRLVFLGGPALERHGFVVKAIAEKYHTSPHLTTKWSTEKTDERGWSVTSADEVFYPEILVTDESGRVVSICEVLRRSTVSQDTLAYLATLCRREATELWIYVPAGYVEPVRDVLVAHRFPGSLFEFELSANDEVEARLVKIFVIEDKKVEPE